jgi:hypothetical protein
MTLPEDRSSTKGSVRLADLDERSSNVAKSKASKTIGENAHSTDSVGKKHSRHVY